MRFFDVAGLPVSPWRNGGGDTREIACGPAGAEGFGWRASVATIAAEGPFSAFPGVDRTITLLAGDGVTLSADGMAPHELVGVGEPFAFSGDLAVSASLRGGACRVLNIMTGRGAWAAEVRRIEAAALPRGGGVGVGADVGAGVLYVLSGRWTCGATTLEAGHGAWWPDACDDDVVPTSEGAVALRADIRQVR